MGKEKFNAEKKEKGKRSKKKRKSGQIFLSTWARAFLTFP